MTQHFVQDKGWLSQSHALSTQSEDVDGINKDNMYKEALPQKKNILLAKIASYWKTSSTSNIEILKAMLIFINLGTKIALKPAQNRLVTPNPGPAACLGVRVTTLLLLYCVLH